MKHRREMHLSRPTVVIMGARFRFYTLHPTDRRYTSDDDGTRQPFALDGWYTVTLAAIGGLHHCEPACMMVELT